MATTDIAPRLLEPVAAHYHRALTAHEGAQGQLARLGLNVPELITTFRIGYGDRSILEKIPVEGELRDQLRALGILAKGDKETLAGCLVVPLADPQTGECAGFFGRDIKNGRDLYTPHPPRGVLNFQAAKASSEIVLTGSVLDALSLYAAGIRNAIPIYGSGGLTAEHVDLLKRDGVTSIVLLFPVGDVWRKAKQRVRTKLTDVGITVRVAGLPKGCQTANVALTTHGDKAGDRLRECLRGDDAAPKRAAVVPIRPAPTAHKEPPAAAGTPPVAPSPAAAPDTDGQIRVTRGTVTYLIRPYPVLLGRLRTTIRAEHNGLLHIDTVDLYSSRARTDFAKRAGTALDVDAARLDADLVAILVEAEKALARAGDENAPQALTMTDAERAEALDLLRRADLLDQVVRDMDTLGYVGEDANKRLLYLVSVSRKLSNPISAVILSQSAAGKSGLSDVIERLTPEEDVLFLTRLSPQSLFYAAPDFLNQKLVIIEERKGSAEVDYPVRAIQSRGRLSVAAPAKDPHTGETRTRMFCIQARASFIESTTDTSINLENGSRCFEVSMDESVEQTKRIHERQRLMKTPEGVALRETAEAIVGCHWNAQRLLEPLPVVIPYARLLTFPSAWMRTRRDNARFLNLIEVSAFLHQYQRERQGGAIVASVDDYRIAHHLSAAVLADTLSDVKRPLKQALERIRQLGQEQRGAISRRQIREALQLPDTTVRRWLKELVELEYLVPERPRPGEGKSTVYRTTAPGAGDTNPELLTPEELVGRVTAAMPPTRHRAPSTRGRVQAMGR